MRVSCVWDNGQTTEENVARGQNAVGLKEYLRNKHGREVARLEVEGLVVPDDADLAGWIGTAEGHEVRVYTIGGPPELLRPDTESRRETVPEAVPEIVRDSNTEEREREVEPSARPPNPPSKISIKLSDQVSLVLEKGFVVDQNKLHLEKPLVKTIQSAAIASDNREPAQIIAQAAGIIARRLRDWGPEFFPIIVFAFIAILFGKTEGNWSVVFIFSGLLLIFLTNIVLSVVFGYNILSELPMPELFKKVDSPEDLVPEVPRTALPYIQDTDRVVEEMRTKLTVYQHIYMFFTSMLPTVIEPWQKEMRLRRSVYEEAVAIVRRRQTQS